MAARKKKKSAKVVAQPSPPKSSHPKPESGWKVPAAFLILITIGGLIYLYRHNSTDTAKEHLQKTEIPSPDLSKSEPQVAAKITRLIEEVRKQPGSADAWGKLAMNLDVHDFRVEAVRAYRSAHELNSRDFRWAYFCAISLHDQKSSDAIEWYQRAIPLRSEFAPVHIRYGRALFDAGKLEDAEAQFRNALQADPRSAHAHLGIARIAFSRNDFQSAISELNAALEIHPGFGEAHGLLAEIFRRTNQSEKASFEIRTAQRLPDTTPIADSQYADLTLEGVSSTWYETRGRSYLESGRYDEAISELTRCIEIRADARVYDVLGIAYQYKKQYEEALKYHLKALELRPDYAGGMNNAATTFLALGEKQKAIEYLDRALEADPDFAFTYLNLARIYQRNGQVSDAVRIYRSGLSRIPDHDAMQSRLAWILATSKDPSLRNGEEAERIAESICEETGFSNPESLELLAAAAAENGNFSKALDAGRRAYDIAAASGRKPLAEKILSQLKLYEKKVPYHE